MRAALRLAVLCLTALAGCKVPADPHQTARHVQGGVLEVGALTPLTGPDAEAVDRIAAEFDAWPRIHRGGPHSLMAMLERGELNLVAGEIPDDTPFADAVGLTRPIGGVRVGDETKDRVLAIRKGENAFLMRVDKAIRGMAP